MLNTWCIFRLKQAGPAPCNVLTHGHIPGRSACTLTQACWGYRVGIHSHFPQKHHPALPFEPSPREVREARWLAPLAPGSHTRGRVLLRRPMGEGACGEVVPLVALGTAGLKSPVCERPRVLSTMWLGQGILAMTGVSRHGVPSCPGRWHQYSPSIDEEPGVQDRAGTCGEVGLAPRTSVLGRRVSYGSCASADGPGRSSRALFRVHTWSSHPVYSAAG